MGSADLSRRMVEMNHGNYVLNMKLVFLLFSRGGGGESKVSYRDLGTMYNG